MNKTVNVKNITLISMGIALNVVGAFIALNLRLPIYLDSIGTILIACMLGPKYAVITGVGGSLVDRKAIYSGDYDIITKTAKEFVRDT